jgi:hypothetical protein
MSPPRRLTGRSSTWIARSTAVRDRPSILRSASTAGPVVRDQRINRGGRHRQPAAPLVPRQEILCQLEDVALADAKRRDANLDAAQSIEQVGAEQPAIDESRQRPIRRGDDARVDLTRTDAADRSTVGS